MTVKNNIKTYSDLIDRYEEHLIRRSEIDHSEATVQKALGHLNKFREWFGSEPFQNDQHHLNQMIAEARHILSQVKHEKHYSIAYFNDHMTRLMAMMKFAMSYGYCDKMPSDHLFARLHYPASELVRRYVEKTST